MPATAMRILVVGSHSPATRAATERLALLGWGAQFVETLGEARIVLGTAQVDAVLALEYLPDGRGYELIEAVAQQSGTLLVSVALSENSLWLPVIDQGKRVLGTRAINGSALESEIELLLSDSARRHAVSASASPNTHHAAAKHAVPPRRKIGGATRGAMSAEVPPGAVSGAAGARQTGRTLEAK